MSSQSLPDFDALWDYANPDQTEAKFCEILLQFPEDEPAFLELLTQIARAQGLQHKLDQAHQTLDQVERRLGEVSTRPNVRYRLERDRVFNSSGKPSDWPDLRGKKRRGTGLAHCITIRAGHIMIGAITTRHWKPLKTQRRGSGRKAE